jgi:hypothetical protein
MLHTLFFALSYLTDYHALADAFDSGIRFGFFNACVACMAVGWQVFRARLAARNR